MAFRKNKKFVPRRGKARAGRTGKSKSVPRVGKLVEATVARELKKSKRGVPRSVVVKLSPCDVNRDIGLDGGHPKFWPVEGDKWTAYMNGEESESKYAMFPLSELIPSQRPVGSWPDDCQRQFDTVQIKGVSLRMAVVHSDQVRVQCLATRNGNRRDLEMTTRCRPFEVIVDDNAVPRRLNYEVMDKDDLFGKLPKGRVGAKHMSCHDGPFATRFGEDGVEWKSTDGTSFTSRLSSEEARPVGRVYVSVDGSPKNYCGQTCNMMLNTGGLMRSIGTADGSGIGGSLTGYRYREVEIYIELNAQEKFTHASGSRSVNERPLELFFAFDGPTPFQVKEKSIPSGSITCMNMEVYYS